MAAMSALSPVKGAVGSKLAAAAEAEDVEEEEPEPLSLLVGMVLGLALPV